jgi:hypothetical protein
MANQTAIKYEELMLPSAFLVMPLTESDFATVDAIVTTANAPITGSNAQPKFTIDADPTSSFYPKCTLLNYTNFFTRKRAELKELTAEVSNEPVTFTVYGFSVTNRGLLFLEFEAAPAEQKMKVAIAQKIQSCRAFPENDHPFGYQYINTNFHLTVATGYSPELLEQRLPDLKQFIGKTLTFEPARWILRRKEWSERDRVEEV